MVHTEGAARGPGLGEVGALALVSVVQLLYQLAVTGFRQLGVARFWGRGDDENGLVSQLFGEEATKRHVVTMFYQHVQSASICN